MKKPSPAGGVMSDWGVAHYEFSLPVRHYHNGPRDAGLVVCLHGYQDHALSMLRRLGWWREPLPFAILAINAPFPVPVWNADGFKEAYAWYFRDSRGGDGEPFVLVSPESTAERMGQVISDLGFAQSQKVLFGFSQGGFLAPYLAAHTQNVRGIIGLGCGYPSAAYSKIEALPVLGLHGELDTRVDGGRARAELSEVKSLGFDAHFEDIAGLEHKVDRLIEPRVRQQVLTWLGQST